MNQFQVVDDPSLTNSVRPTQFSSTGEKALFA
jgi:hypothetical protein